jgi:hypothetical protein
VIRVSGFDALLGVVPRVSGLDARLRVVIRDCARPTIVTMNSPALCKVRVKGMADCCRRKGLMSLVLCRRNSLHSMSSSGHNDCARDSSLEFALSKQWYIFMLFVSHAMLDDCCCTCERNTLSRKAPGAPLNNNDVLVDAYAQVNNTYRTMQVMMMS